MTLEPNWALMRSPMNYAVIFLMITFFMFSLMLINKVVLS